MYQANRTEFEYTPPEELKLRVARLQKDLQENEIAGALISQNADLFYFSGTIQSSYLFIPAQGKPVLAVQKSFERALEESGLDQIVPLKSINRLNQVLSDFNLSVKGRIGLELDVLPTKHYFSLCKKFPEADFLDISEYIRKARMIKSEYEVTQIKKACSIVTKVMEEARRIIRPGMTELEIDALLGRLSRSMGHQGRLRMRGYNQEMPYNAHVFCGKAASTPSFMRAPLGGRGTTPAIAQGASSNTIAENTPIIIDFVVGINGYVADMTRTFIVGRLPQKFQKAYSFAKEIKDSMESQAKPGKLCSSLHEESVKLAHERGYGEYFMGYGENQVPFVGHGIGLELDEYPVIGRGFNRELEENMVFAFEPKFVFPGEGVAGVEDDYLVTSTGVERLTTYDDNVLTVYHER